MSDLEALGDAVTGGMIGRAVEPGAGETGYTHEKTCLNCGAELLGPYCSACGQHAHVHRTLSAFFHDFLHGVLHFEGRIWHTLPLLAWKPGELTRRYIDGQRARFVSPIALFLFCVFIMFAALSLTGNFGSVPAAAKQDIQKDIAKDKKKLEVLEAQRAKVSGNNGVGESLDEIIAEVKSETAAHEAIKDKNLPVSNLILDGSDGMPDWIVDAVGKAKSNPELVVYKIKTNAYKFSWALIPISVPFVWLLFPFSRKFSLYDHTVFVTYSLCFMMLLLIASSVIGLVSEAIASLAWFVPPIHMYRQLRGTYALSGWSALWRTAALTIFAFISISLFTSLLVGLGAFE